MNEVILEKFCDLEKPKAYEFIDLEYFGESKGKVWRLYDYQQHSLKNALNCLKFYDDDNVNLLDKYKSNGLNEVFKNKLAISKSEDNESFNILENHYEIENEHLPFEKIYNRASFWMATGSGKTLVMIKLIELLFRLSKLDKEDGGIPKNDILLLAPTDQILNQIKEHVEIFNNKSDLFIELRSLKEWERTKNESINLYGESTVTVFYYKSHNLKEAGESTENELNYDEFLHGTEENGLKYGSWYIILDEAHKGVTGDSKRQNIYQVLAKKGFLFNFSATFTDAIDRATTVFNFNLERFINEGYGKHLKVTNQEFRDFNKRKDSETSEEDKREIILKSLIVLTAIKKAKAEIDEIRKGLYHNPLMITVANTIQTTEADLKLFFRELANIAKESCDIKTPKNQLLQEFYNNEDKNFAFRSGKIDAKFLQLIEQISFADIKEYVFNAEGSGTIELINIEGNQRELAFKMSTANSRPFALLVASEATNWIKDLDNYTVSTDVISESYYERIKDPDNEINIMLGKQIFTLGWDSPRPNVINFINIGVSDAQKFVLQSIGRGIRIQPINGVRKRFKVAAEIKDKFNAEKIEQIEKYCQGLETVYIFSTKKETVGAILENIEKNETREEWQKIEGIEKTEIDKELPVPEYEKIEKISPNKFNLTKREHRKVKRYVKEYGNKILIAKNGFSVRTLKRIKEDYDKFFARGKTKDYSEEKIIYEIERHFNSKPRKLSYYRKIGDTDITHYEHIKTTLEENELKELTKRIRNELANHNPYKSIDELRAADRRREIKSNEQFELYLEQIQSRKSKPNVKFPDITEIKEHYYNPTLVANEINKSYFRNIIKEPSETEFFDKLVLYKIKDKNKLDNYDWWFFSKLVENVDKITIPYYSNDKGRYADFNPDFIFWLKKDGKYFIKFVDPKGIEQGQEETADKVKGFEEIFQNGKKITFNKKPVEVELHLFNPKGASRSKEVSKYSRTEIEEIF